MACDDGAPAALLAAGAAGALAALLTLPSALLLEGALGALSNIAAGGGTCRAQIAAAPGCLVGVRAALKHAAPAVVQQVTDRWVLSRLLAGLLLTLCRVNVVRQSALARSTCCLPYHICMAF